MPSPDIREGEIRELARLARLHLDDAEVARLRADLAAILAFAAQLRAVDTAGVEPMTHAVLLDGPLREDIVAPSLSVEDAVGPAPRREGDLFVVPRVVAARQP